MSRVIKMYVAIISSPWRSRSCSVTYVSDIRQFNDVRQFLSSRVVSMLLCTSQPSLKDRSINSGPAIFEKSTWPSWAPVPNKPTVSVDIIQQSAWKKIVFKVSHDHIAAGLSQISGNQTIA